jgi:hypothetical protein
MKKFQLEMGGKNPMVVLDDADLGVAVNCASSSRCRWGWATAAWRKPPKPAKPLSHDRHQPVAPRPAGGRRRP